MAHGEYREPRGRNFAFVQKVENLPEDWQKVAADKLLPMAWVLHNEDRYTEKDQEKNQEHKAGELVEPHVHFFVYFNGKRTASGVVDMFSEFNIACPPVLNATYKPNTHSCIQSFPHKQY